MIRELGLRPEQAVFWATNAGAELDLLTFAGGARIGFEAKRADAPSVTRSMRAALDDLRLTHLYVVHPGPAEIALDARVTAIGLPNLTQALRALRPSR